MKLETINDVIACFEKEIISPEGKEKLIWLKSFCENNLEDGLLTPVNYPTISEEEYNFLCNIDQNNYDIIKRYGFQVFLSKKNSVNVTCNVTKLFGEQWFQTLEMNQEYDIKLLIEIYDYSRV